MVHGSFFANCTCHCYLAFSHPIPLAAGSAERTHVKLAFSQDGCIWKMRYICISVYPPDGHFIGKIDEKCIEPWDLGDFWVPYFQTNPDVHRMSKSLLTRQRRHWLRPWHFQRLHAIEIMRIRVRLWPWLLHEENESKRVAWPDSLERMIS